MLGKNYLHKFNVQLERSEIWRIDNNIESRLDSNIESKSSKLLPERTVFVK